MKKYVIAVSVMLAVAAAGFYFYNADNAPASSATATDPGTTLPPAQAPSQSKVNEGVPYKDTSMLKPPTGAKVAIYVFEDLECPACARSAPVLQAAAAQYKVPIERRDYPWTFHKWSFDAAVTARYIQDSISPELADTFRHDVFANQPRIESKDDLANFTTAWFKEHNKTMPFVIDPKGTFRSEVQSDHAMGDQLGLQVTPTIFVVTESQWVPITDVNQLDTILENALAQAGSKPGA